MTPEQEQDLAGRLQTVWQRLKCANRTPEPPSRLGASGVSGDAGAWSNMVAKTLAGAVAFHWTLHRRGAGI